MKLLKFLSLASLALFPMAPSSVSESARPTQLETESLCGQDQSYCGRCGDNYCAKQCGETATSCPQDCGTQA
jgi:hypothetical protein